MSNGQSGFIKKGSLQGLEHYADAQSNHSTDSPWYILFHGYGADAYDLFGLHDVTPVKKTLNWFCPQGPLSVHIGPGWTGRAWWNIDMLEIQRAATQGIEREFSNDKPPELPSLREKVIASIEKIAPWEQIILGGFSQGAMLATDIYLHAPKTPRGLTILSGSLLNRPEWEPLVKNRQGEEFFMAHGKYDQVLKYAGAQRLHQILTSGGMLGTLNTFSGAHEIPANTIAQLGAYLTKKI